jgi:hypothetical protein
MCPDLTSLLRFAHDSDHTSTRYWRLQWLNADRNLLRSLKRTLLISYESTTYKSENLDLSLYTQGSQSAVRCKIVEVTCFCQEIPIYKIA